MKPFRLPKGGQKNAKPLEAGEIFGRLTVIGPAPSIGYNLRYELRCLCGAKVYRLGYELRSALKKGVSPACQDCRTVDQSRASKPRARPVIIHKPDELARSYKRPRVPNVLCKGCYGDGERRPQGGKCPVCGEPYVARPRVRATDSLLQPAPSPRQVA
jgi:hypothetical protein